MTEQNNSALDFAGTDYINQIFLAYANLVRLFNTASSSATNLASLFCSKHQRWSRGHKARGQGQGHKKNPRPRTAFPWTDTLEAKDRNARGQGQGPRTQAQVLSKIKKKGFHKNFLGDLQKKKILFSSDLLKTTFSKKCFKRSTKF